MAAAGYEAEHPGPVAQVLLAGRPNRSSLETAKSAEAQKLAQKGSLEEALSGAEKLTLMDLIKEQKAEAGGPAPGLHLTRQRTAHEQFQKKIAALKAGAGTNKRLKLTCRI